MALGFALSPEGAGVGAVSAEDSARPAGVPLGAGFAVDDGWVEEVGFEEALPVGSGLPLPDGAGVAGAVGSLPGTALAAATAST